MPKRIGIESVPNEDEIKEWLNVKVNEATDKAALLAQEFLEVVEVNEQQGNPEIFAYARLLNYLAELDSPTMLRILSAYVWQGYIQTKDEK